MTRTTTATILAVLATTTGLPVTDTLIDTWTLTLAPYPDHPDMLTVAAQLARTYQQPRPIRAADFATAWQQHLTHLQYTTRPTLPPTTDDQRTTPEQAATHIAALRAHLDTVRTAKHSQKPA